MPSNIRAFAILSFLGLLLYAAWIAYFHHDIDAYIAARSVGQTGDALHSTIEFTYEVFFTIGYITGCLIWLAAFHRMIVAQWGFAAVTAVMSLETVRDYASPANTSRTSIPFDRPVETLVTVMFVIALYLSFTGNAKGWFRRQPNSL